MCIFHKWTKWEQYTFNKADKDKRVVEIERRQRKHCEKCNKEQDEWISTSDFRCWRKKGNTNGIN